MREHFVGVASDADDPEDEVLDLARRIEGAMMLPFVIFADAEGNYLDGYSGVVTPPYLLKKLGELTAS